MRKIILLWVMMVAVLLALSYRTPQAGAAQSPIATPTIEPHFRPTPTGWPDAPFPWETPAASPNGARLQMWLPLVEK
jgi:hypothetical protein